MRIDLSTIQPGQQECPIRRLPMANLMLPKPPSLLCGAERCRKAHCGRGGRQAELAGLNSFQAIEERLCADRLK